MLPNSKDKKDQEKQLEKNLKLMGLSAVVLVVLFGYTLLKSENTLQGTSYYVGIVFLFIMLILSIALQKYRKQIRQWIPKNKFQKELQEASEHDMKSEKNNSIETMQTHIESVSSNISFKDIAGIKEIKEELEEVVDFLNNPKKYQQYGVNLPKGVLLVGPPGVGKTLIAKAVAGEANVPFFYQSGASFVHIYVGMGAKKVRELFMAAKQSAPSIIFIDEIDAVGKQRGIGNNDEREATLNELLTQMDGFNSASGVIVIAATNKIEVLDEALLRAGRFDRRVFLNLPNKEDRQQIIELYLKNTNYDFNVEKLSIDTSGFNSSSIATLINEALLCMIKRDGDILSQEDIDTAKQKIEFGKKQVQILNSEQQELLSIYQAAKAFVSQSTVKLHDQEYLQKELLYASREQLEQQIQNYLAGSVALQVIKGQSYAMFANDIQRAYDVAKNMVEIYKMDTEVEHIIKIQKDRLKHHFELQRTVLNELIDKMKKDEVVVF